MLKNKRINAALINYGSLWELTFNSIGSYVTLLDSEFRILTANRACLSFLKKPLKGILGKRCYQVFHNKNASPGFCPLRKLLRTKKRQEVELYLPEKKVWVSICVDPILDKNKNLIAVAHVFDDITERKEIEQALRQNEQKLRLVFENAKDAIFWADPKTGLIINCNKAAELLLEKKRNKIIGHKQTELHPPEKAKNYIKMFKKHIRQKGALDDEAEVITSSGKIKSVHISASVTKVGNRPIMQGIFRDITERKNIEKMKDNLLRDVSHTLKTPIAMLEMAHDMSERGIRDQDIGRIQNSQEIITNNIVRLRKEIDNILNLFTLSETKPIEKKEKVSLAQITNEVIHSLKSIIDRKGLAIKINISQAAERIFMDKRQIEILLNNIIDNAIKFTEGGSVSIAVSQEGRFVKLIVADTGCGIAAKEKTKLFNAFYKRHAALPGAGLGLSICQTIVNRNKGTIKVISGGIGRGTTVIVKLPKGG